MKVEATGRGFDLINFKDRYGVGCSLQKSSLFTEDCIWFGCDEADPKMMVSGKGWQPVKMPAEYIANTRMHLTQEQVRELLPFLEKFAETGELK